MRKMLTHEQIHPTQRDQINSFHSDVVAEVETAVEQNRIVVVACAGMMRCGKRAKT